MVGHARACRGLLLSGGASRRMGRDKALLVVGGCRLADRAAALLTEVCDAAVEVGPGYTSLPSVREDPPGAGPLAAVCAGWSELRSRGHEPPVLVLAVDMPRVTVPLLRLLAGRPGPPTAVPVARGRPQPLCARYGGDALEEAAALLARGERSLRALLASPSLDVAWVEQPEWEAVAAADAFADVDTPADLEGLAGEA